MQPSHPPTSTKRNRFTSSPSSSPPHKKTARLTTTPPPTSPQDDIEMGDASSDDTTDNASAAAADSQSSGDSQAISDLSSSAAPAPGHHRSAAVSGSREQAMSSALAGSAGSSRHDALGSLRSDLGAYLPSASSSSSAASSSSGVRAPPPTPSQAAPTPLGRVQDPSRRGAISSASGFGSLGRIDESPTHSRRPAMTRASGLGFGGGSFGGVSTTATDGSRLGFGIPSTTFGSSPFGGTSQQFPHTTPHGTQEERREQNRGRTPFRTTPPSRRHNDWDDTPGAPSASGRRSSAFSSRSHASSRHLPNPSSSPTRASGRTSGFRAAPPPDFETPSIASSGRGALYFGSGPALGGATGYAGEGRRGAISGHTASGVAHSRNADGSPPGPSRAGGKKAKEKKKREKSKEKWREEDDDSDDEMED